METWAWRGCRSQGSSVSAPRNAGRVNKPEYSRRGDVFKHSKMKYVFFLLFSASLWSQASLDPAKLLQPPTDTWPTYNGDYSGQRYSTLAKINESNVNSLSLAWVYRVNPGPDQAGGGKNAPVIKSTPLEINGVIYFT